MGLQGSVHHGSEVTVTPQNGQVLGSQSRRGDCLLKPQWIRKGQAGTGVRSSLSSAVRSVHQELSQALKQLQLTLKTVAVFWNFTCAITAMMSPHHRAFSYYVYMKS